MVVRSSLNVRVVWLVAAMTAGAVSTALARQEPEWRDIVFSASGGISKGSYQGGLDWTISEFLRRQREDTLRAELGIGHNIRFRMRSVTGASAGNIDALFAAIGWCTQEPKLDEDKKGLRTKNGGHPTEIPPDQSLFWQAWIPTGFTELSHNWDGKGLTSGSPATDDPDDLAALQRRLFYDAHRPAVRAFMEGATPYLNPDKSKSPCSLPVGLTLTKVTPIDVPLKDGLGRASVQRFASVFRVATVGQRVDFAPPEPAQRAARLGALALIPVLENQAATSFGERLAAVFKVVLASSAFPLAFAPVTLCYQPAGLIQSSAGNEYPCHPFADGGLFDNNPLGLAHELGESAGQSEGRVGVAYSSPGNLRGELRDEKRQPAPRAEQAGLGSAMQLVAGAFQSARDYELQGFARVIADDPEDPLRHLSEATRGRAVDLMLSSRSTPIFGETAASFGAFLGRPFREYDFYAGVYDGLEFVARHFVCADRTPEEVKTCTSASHAWLVETDAFHLGDEGKNITAWLLARERTRNPVRVITRAENPRLFLLQRLHEALAERQRTPCDPRLDIVQQTLCAGGLQAPMKKLADTRDDVVAAAKYLLKQCEQVSVAFRQCLADENFVRFLESPDRAFYAAMDDAVASIDQAEETVHKRQPNAPRYELPLNFVAALFSSQTLRYRTGFSINNSTARRMRSHKFASVASYVVPNYVQTVRTRGLENDPVVVGWSLASYTFGSRAYLTASPEWSFQDPRWTGWSGSVSMGWHVRWPLTFSSVEAGVGWLSESRRAKAFEDSGWRLRLSSRFLGEQLQMGVWLLPQNGGRWHRSLGFAIGASNINGLAHWLIRLGS